MVTINTDELLRKIKQNQPVNVSELTKLLGLECNKKNITYVYNKISKLALNGVIRTKRVDD